MTSLDDEPFIEVGYIRKGHGYKGHARVVIFDDWVKDFSKQDFVFLQIDGYKVPYYIEERQSAKDIIIKLEHIDSVEALKKYHRYPLFLLEKDIQHGTEQLENQSQRSSLISMHIQDATLGDLGPIIRIDEYPQQEMAIIKGKDDAEVLIPLHPQLISEIDEEKGILKMDLPEGLI